MGLYRLLVMPIRANADTQATSLLDLRFQFLRLVECKFIWNIDTGSH